MSFFPTKLIISNLIDVLHSDSFKASHRQSKVDFSRHRVLSFVDLVMIQLNRIVLSLSVEIENFLDFLKSSKSYSKQAFSEARKKLKHTAFIALNDQFVKDYYTEHSLIKLWRGQYLLLACDGSLVQLPESEELAKEFGRWKNQTPKGMVMGRASLIYDVLNRVTLEAKLTTCTRGERLLFEEQFLHIQKTKVMEGFSTLFLMDRGYPSFELMKQLDKEGKFFVIRCKGDFCKEVKEFRTEDLDEKYIELSPRSWHKDGQAKPSKYQENLKLRIVRILLSSGEYEYLLSNTDFDKATLSELYQLRWGIETYYGFLKETMQLENFSSKMEEGVLQDFHACILTANLSQLLIAEAQKEVEQENKTKSRKYDYQINQNVAIGILKDKIPSLFHYPRKLNRNLKKLKQKIKRHQIPIIPNRHFERKKLKRNRRKFHFSKKRVL